MRINVYAEHMTEHAPEVLVRVAADGIQYTGLRLHLRGEHNSITFWSAPNQQKELRELLLAGVEVLDVHYADSSEPHAENDTQP